MTFSLNSLSYVDDPNNYSPFIQSFTKQSDLNRRAIHRLYNFTDVNALSNRLRLQFYRAC